MHVAFGEAGTSSVPHLSRPGPFSPECLSSSVILISLCVSAPPAVPALNRGWGRNRVTHSPTSPLNKMQLSQELDECDAG